jgi:hypothetical protein
MEGLEPLSPNVWLGRGTMRRRNPRAGEEEVTGPEMMRIFIFVVIVAVGLKDEDRKDAGR